MTRLTRSLAYATQTAALILGLAACPDGPAVDPTSNCPVDYLLSNASFGMSVDHHLPKVCPVKIGAPGQNTPYAAAVKALAGKALMQVTVRVIAWDGATDVGGGGGYFNPDPSEPEYYVVAQPNGSYSAGTVEPAMGLGQLGADRAHNVAVDILGFEVSIVDVQISYVYSALASLNPVGTATLNSSYSQGVTLTSLAAPVGSVSYEWLQDGVSLGPASPYNTWITTSFSSFGSHTLEVIATDAGGNRAHWISDVLAMNPPNCPEPCDGR